MEINGISLERSNMSYAQNNIQNATRKLSGVKGNSAKLQEVADEFESMFIKLVLDSMKKTIDEKKNPFYGGLSEDMFSSMLYEEYSSLMAQHSDFGFSEAITQQYKQYV